MRATVPGRHQAEVPSVQAELRYRQRQGAELVNVPVDRRRAFEMHAVPIRDARPFNGELALQRDGFQLVHQRSAVKDFFDAQQIERIYRAETVDLIRSLTGAETVLTFRWKWRNSSQDKRKEVLVEDPAQGVHIDYDVETVRRITRDLVGEVEAERLLAQRFSLINVWRPLTPVEMKPLALCDPTTVAWDDVFVVSITTKPPDTIFDPPLAGYNLTFNPAHRWYYFPRMEPDEALVFRLADSDHDQPQLTAHTTFDDPTSPANARPRESFEIRTIAFYPD